MAESSSYPEGNIGGEYLGSGPGMGELEKTRQKASQVATCSGQ